MSRSVMVPTSRSFSQIGSMPTSSAFIFCAACVKIVSGVTHSGSGVRISLIFIRILSSFGLSCLCCLAGRSPPLGGSFFHRAAVSVTRQCWSRGGLMSLPPQRAQGRSGRFRGRPCVTIVPCPAHLSLRLLAGFFRHCSLARRRKLDPGATSRRQRDGDRLLGGSRAMDTFANVSDGLPHKLPRLG